MKMIVLGTGNAGAQKHYHTCFVLAEEDRKEDPYFLVDAGGGNRILRQLKKSEIPPAAIHTIFVTHRHLDHILGVFWILRAVCRTLTEGKYEGELVIYGHDEVTGILRDMSARLLDTEHVPGFSEHVHFVTVEDGRKEQILGREVTFFDIHSTKAKQFGFSMALSGGEKFVYGGDEPLDENGEAYAEHASVLVHEAFCLWSDRKEMDPKGKHHSTVREACALAERLHVRKLILVHTEEKTGKERQKLYRKEGEQYFDGTLLVPEDLDTLEIP